MRSVFRSLILLAGLVGSSAFLPPMAPNSVILSRQLPIMMAGGDEAGVSEKVRRAVTCQGGADPRPGGAVGWWFGVGGRATCVGAFQRRSTSPPSLHASLSRGAR